MKATCRINDKTEDNKSFSKFHSELDKTNKKCVKANAAGDECAKCAEGYGPVAPTGSTKKTDCSRCIGSTYALHIKMICIDSNQWTVFFTEACIANCIDCNSDTSKCDKCSGNLITNKASGADGCMGKI